MPMRALTFYERPAGPAQIEVTLAR
jgi:hypothetical protein